MSASVRIPTIPILLLVGALALGGCTTTNASAQPGGSSPETSASPSPTAVAPGPTSVQITAAEPTSAQRATTTTADPAPISSAPPPSVPGIVTVDGVVRSGTLPGCTRLDADDGRHFVLADVTDPPLDVPVEVTGTVDPTELSYCNSGATLHVQRITRR